jgi:hypothetical protein
MENKLLEKFLSLIDSDLSDFKAVTLNTRLAIIDSYGDEELQGLSNEFRVSVSEIKNDLRKAAKDLDGQDLQPKHKKRSHIPHIKHNDKEEKSRRKTHKIEKPTEHEKQKVIKRLKKPRPSKHNEKGHTGHTGHTDTTKTPPPPPPNPPKLPPLTIDDVTIVATYKKQK